MLRPLILLACAFPFTGAPGHAQKVTWELGCSLQIPKLASIPQRLDPSDSKSPVLLEWTYVYAKMGLENSSENTLPLALRVGVVPMRGETRSGRQIPALLAGPRALAAIREAEGDEKLVDFYDLPPQMESGASLEAFALLASMARPVGADGAPRGALPFPAEFDLRVGGLRFEVEERDGRAVALPRARNTRFTFGDGKFSGGTATQWVDEEGIEGIDLGEHVESWSPEAEADALDAWELKLQVERPRPVYVIKPPQGVEDVRTVAERTDVYWYVRVRIQNPDSKPRPLNLTVRVLTRQTYTAGGEIIAQLEDPAVSPQKKAYLRKVLGEVEYLPIDNDDAYRAAAAQEVSQHGAIFGPVSYFSLPAVIEPMPTGVADVKQMLRTKPKGAFDAIVLLTSKLDPRVTEFEVRVGGIRNQVDWLSPDATPSGPFAKRKLEQVFEEHITRFRRYGSDEILSDPFRRTYAGWVRLSGPAGSALQAVDLSSTVKVGESPIKR